MDPYYFFPKNDQEKEKISNYWKYFPDLNPVLEMDNGFEDGDATGPNTPGVIGTPIPGTDYINAKTPGMDNMGQFHSPGQGAFSTIGTPMGGPITPQRG